MDIFSVLLSFGLPTIFAVFGGLMFLTLFYDEVFGNKVRPDLRKWATGTGIILMILGVVLFLIGQLRVNNPRSPVEQELRATITALEAKIPTKPTPIATDLQDMVVLASKYPFDSSRLQVNEGDTVEVSFQSPENNKLSCYNGEEPVNPSGASQPADEQMSLLLPSANFCELIGYLQPGDYIPIGSQMRFTARQSGILFLGINDVPPEKCQRSDKNCYIDNKGRLQLKIIVMRK